MQDMELTNVLWACGKLGYAPEGAFERLVPLLISRQVPQTHAVPIPYTLAGHGWKGHSSVWCAAQKQASITGLAPTMTRMVRVHSSQQTGNLL